MPLDADYPEERLASILGDSGASALLTQRDSHEREHEGCSFARAHSIERHVSLLETPLLCRGCIDFYQYMGLETEIEATENLIVRTNTKINAVFTLPWQNASPYA